MKVRWSMLARDQFYEVLEYLVQHYYGAQAATNLQRAVEMVERNLQSGLVTYPTSKKMGIRNVLYLNTTSCYTWISGKKLKLLDLSPPRRIIPTKIYFHTAGKYSLRFCLLCLLP